MSMRATYTTEFIYDGSDGYLVRKDKLMSVLEQGETELDRDNHGGMVIGQISGVTHGLDLGESDIKRWIDEQCYELSKITIVPFKICWLLEGGDVIIKTVEKLSS